MKAKENIELFLEKLLFIDASDKNELSVLEAEFNCKILVIIEKHNSLQFSYFYDVDFGESENFYIEIENGINNGTVLINAEWGVSTLSKTKTVRVLKDIIVDESKCINSNQFAKAKAILAIEKPKLFEFERKDNYDNYVTGGNSKMSKSPIQEELSELLEFIYEEKEVDCNFI